MRKAKVVRDKDLEWTPGQEPPLRSKKGIGSKTVDSPHLRMSRALIPPGARNQRHYHVNCDAGFFVLKGRLKIFMGPNHEMEETTAEAGDFVFVPAGAIHGLMNLSNTEPAEIISTKNNVSHAEQEGTMFVEPRWDK